MFGKGTVTFAQESVNTTVSPPPSQAKTVSLWIDARRFDLNETTANVIVQLPNVQRIIVPLLSEGETLFASSETPFPQIPAYRNKADVLSTVIEKAHQNKIQVYGAVNLLRWGAPGLQKGGILTQHPEWSERVFGGSTGVVTLGRFASPFHPQTMRLVQNFLGETQKLYPGLDRFLLDFRLPSENYYGLSETWDCD